MSKNNKGSRPTNIYETPTAPAIKNIPKNQPRIINDNGIYETINNAIYENEAAQNTPDESRNTCKWLVFLFLFQCITFGILLYISVKDEISTYEEVSNTTKERDGKMESQITFDHSVNSSITENKNKIDDISRKLDEIDKIVNPKQILVMGGWNGTKSSSDMFLLDYYGKTWKQVSIKLPNNTHSHGTVILKDQLYIIGGKDEKDNYYNTLYRLNKQMKWEKLADIHEKRTYIGSSCLVHNGNIWVIGGYSGNNTYSNTMEKYDPVTNRWEKKAMKRGRLNAAAAVINNKIYVCGGWDRYSVLDSVEVFDIEAEVWTDFNTLPARRTSMSIIVDGTSIIVIGGFDGSSRNTVWRMDVEDRNKGWMSLQPLNEGRYGSSAVRIKTGATLVVGGCLKDKCEISSSAVEIFDGHKWDTVSPLPLPRGWPTSVVLTPAMIDAFRPHVSN